MDKELTQLPEFVPWDLNKLHKPPALKWLNQSGNVWSLIYSGLPYAGQETSVFAHYASPQTLNKADNGRTFPAIVLIHGGGGTAFGKRVEHWAERGFAAIAMDLGGCTSAGERLSDGGPDQTEETKFMRMDRPVTDQWNYHAVANVILAHSLLLTLDGVDREKTALKGISWGGVLAFVAAALDRRFKAAVIVYSSGFLHELAFWKENYFSRMSSEHALKWTSLWDPSRYVKAIEAPLFLVTGTNDEYYWLECFAQTYELANCPVNTRITVGMKHDHSAGSAPKEIERFVARHLTGTEPLPEIVNPHCINGVFSAEINATIGLQSAEIHYTNDNLPSPQRQWHSEEARIEENFLFAEVPSEAVICYATVTDATEMTMSSKLLFLNRP